MRKARRPNDQRLLRRRLLRAGVASLGGALFPMLAARPQPVSADIATTDLGGLALLQVAGVNVLALHGDDGALMVDGGPKASADALLRAVYAATRTTRIHTLINTHGHPDQTGANELVGKAGGVILAHEKTQLYLSHAMYSALLEGRQQPLPEAARPNQTTRGEGTLEFAGKRIEYGYLPAAHTDGDLFVHFPQLERARRGRRRLGRAVAAARLPQRRLVRRPRARARAARELGQTRHPRRARRGPPDHGTRRHRISATSTTSCSRR